MQIDVADTDFRGFFTRRAVTFAFSDALRQLGGTVGDAGQVVRVTYGGAPCDCAGCGPYTVAVSSPVEYLVVFCPYVQQNYPVLTDAAMKHELVHTLTHRGDHLPCESGAVMSAELRCEVVVGQYIAADITYLCESGYVSGGVCAR